MKNENFFLDGRKKVQTMNAQATDLNLGVFFPMQCPIQALWLSMKDSLGGKGEGHTHTHTQIHTHTQTHTHTHTHNDISLLSIPVAIND